MTHISSKDGILLLYLKTEHFQSYRSFEYFGQRVVLGPKDVSPGDLMGLKPGQIHKLWLVKEKPQRW